MQGELAQMLWQFNFNWTGADRAYRQALEVAPRNARLWYWRGTMLAVGGRFDAALDSLARSEELDPLSPMIPANRGWIHYFARRLATRVPDGKVASALAAWREIKLAANAAVVAHGGTITHHHAVERVIRDGYSERSTDCSGRCCPRRSRWPTARGIVNPGVLVDAANRPIGRTGVLARDD